MYILIAFKKRNGMNYDYKVLEQSNQKSRLEYLIQCCGKYDELKSQNYYFEIYELKERVETK